VILLFFTAIYAFACLWTLAAALKQISPENKSAPVRLAKWMQIHRTLF